MCGSARASNHLPAEFARDAGPQQQPAQFQPLFGAGGGGMDMLGPQPPQAASASASASARQSLMSALQKRSEALKVMKSNLEVPAEKDKKSASDA